MPARAGQPPTMGSAGRGAPVGPGRSSRDHLEAHDHGRLSARAPRQIVIHDFAQGEAALAAAAALGCAIRLRSAPDVAAAAGVGYLQALGAALGQELLIDCGTDPGLVMAALRAGCRTLLFAGPEPLFGRLADLAVRHGASLKRPGPAGPDLLQLEPGTPAGARCSAWLAELDQRPEPRPPPARSQPEGPAALMAGRG